LLDPACGTGNFLVAAARRLGTTRNLVGLDTDPRAINACRKAVGGDTTLIVGDAFTADLSDGTFDVVVGNPPFLTQLRRERATHLATRATRLGTSLPPYVDEASMFLVLATRLARADGGRVAFVQPLSMLATRDGGWARAAVRDLASVEHLWIASENVFAADVATCAIGLCRGRPQGPISRAHGEVALADIYLPDGSWAPLLADALGVPGVALRSDRTIGDVAAVTADFRDEFYEVASLVEDGGEGAQVITSGLIDVGRVRWGEANATIARRRFTRPTVPTSELSGRLRARLVPKVVVATQTRVIEAAVDEKGEWLPAVPVISIVTEGTQLWPIATALCSPPLTAWAATQHLGAARSSSAIKLSASDLRALPLPEPSASWEQAEAALRAGDVLESGRLMCTAYGVDDTSFTWWRDRLPRR
jgi:SAM-dependent methyltransferase